MLQPLTITFLKNLAKNNHKDWFEKNRKLYEAAKADYLGFVTIVLHEMKQIDSTLEALEPKQCVFRINRDVRFSKNKDPYKNNMGAHFSMGGKKIQTAGYYFHCQPGESFIGGGVWMPMAPELKKIRQEIDYNYTEFKNIVTAPKFKKHFNGLDQSAILSRPPKGYEEDNEAIDYLKLKSFTAIAPIADEGLTNKSLVKKIITHFEAMKPLINFLNRSLVE
jgi:uncharacterized protein (TIGR02453 family)